MVGFETAKSVIGKVGVKSRLEGGSHTSSRPGKRRMLKKNTTLLLAKKS